MELFDSIIKNTLETVSKYESKSYSYSEDKSWETIGRNQLILAKESAYELGGSFLPSVSYSCVTTSESIGLQDGITVIGKDLQEIKEDVPFARLVLLETYDLGDEQESYDKIKKLELMKYDSILLDYMMRASTLDKREQVRVGKTAIKNGVSFEKIGSAYIKMYKSSNLVKNVHIIFITEKIHEFKTFVLEAQKIKDITNALNTLVGGLSMDCHSCGLKSICDEVEGLKELHFKSKK